MKLPLLLSALLPLVLPCRGTGIEDFESSVPDTVVAAGGEVSTSTAHFKSGRQSLLWSWVRKSRPLTIANPAPDEKPGRKAGFAMWIHLEEPIQGKWTFELLRQGKVVASGWFWMDFTGWRILGFGYQQLGPAAGQPVDAIRFQPPEGKDHGRVCFDMVSFGLDYSAPRSLQTPWVGVPDGLTKPRSAILSADDPSLNRPWLPKKSAQLTEKEAADIKLLESAFLTAKTAPGRGLPKGRLEELRKTIASYELRRDGASIAGKPIDGGTVLKPDGFIPMGAYLKTCDAVKSAWYQAKDPAEEAEVKRMFVDLTAHLLDQGWAQGLRLAAWDNYPIGQYACFYAMKDVLADAGLTRPVAQALIDNYGSHGSGDFAAEHPSSSMDGLGFWHRELYACSLMFPTGPEQLQHLRISQRFLNLALVNPTTIAPDGCTYHHGGFHYAYASYNMPRLLQVLAKAAPTGFRIDAAAQERLKTYVRALAFTSSHGEQAYNLGMRAGFPMNTMGVEPVARELAGMGSPDGKQKVDAEMAAVSLRLLAESQPGGPHPNFAKDPWKSWIDQGIQPAPAPAGFLAMNGGPVAIHRRDGWLANIAGINPFYRGIEIYGWTQANNYGRFARNGSLVITSQGNPPDSKAGGWAVEGWNWCHFPGTTAIRFANEQAIFDGYAMYGNSRQNVGGTSLDQDGVWCMDFAGWGLSFKKTYFCFDNRITSVTTGIRPQDARSTNPLVTTLFQNSITPGTEFVVMDGDKLESFPDDRVLAAGQSHWLIDNKQTGYLIPAGNDGLHLQVKPQSWRYLFKKYLADPGEDPISGEITYQNIRGKIKDLTTIENFYQPTEGDFALAWFDHGIQPASASCVYTAVIKTTGDAMKRLAEQPAFEVLQHDEKAHVFHDRPSDTFACAIYQPGEALAAATPLRSCSEPCVLMIRREGKNLRFSLCYTSLGNTVPAEKNLAIRLVVAGQWKLAKSSSTASAQTTGEDTTLTLKPGDNTPIQWELQPE